MKIAVLSLVLLGVLAAVSAAVLTAAIASRGESASAVRKEAEVEVLLAARDLPAMSVVQSAAVKTKKIPAAQMPENALLNPVQVVGKVVTERVIAEQVFTKACFARENAGVYLAAAVPPGKRAMSIQLSDWSGMAGLLYPGSVVDVLVSFKTLGGEAKSNDEAMSTTLLQGMQVLAIGSQSIADQEFKDKNPGAMAATGQMNSRMITLLVDPKQAEILQLAMDNGSISLVMRNPLDAAQESRRLTRAREIAPNRNGVSDGGGAFDIAAALKLAGQQRAAQDAQPTTRPNPLWETLIIRGTQSEKRSFPMPADGN